MPSKKIILVFIACTIAVLLVFFAAQSNSFAKKDNTVTTPTEGTKLLVEKVVEESANKDDDNDGLKNWEEGLWHTDPENPDTDGNGTPDGEQVKKQIENTDIATIKTGQASGASDSDEDKTKTNEFSKKFFAEYMVMKKAGDIDTNAMQKLVNDSISSVDIQSEATYTLKDIITVPDTNIVLARAYGNNLAIIREKYAKIYAKNPISAGGAGTSKVSLSDDPNFISSVTNASDIYKKMALELKVTPVPAGLSQTHLSLINSYITSSAGLKEFALLKSDPIVALGGIKKYKSAQDEEAPLLTDAAYYFLNNGIIFSEDEPGFRTRGQ